MSEEFNPFSLSGKTILVTGASSGIGRAISIQCSKMGATIIATGRNSQKIQGTMQELTGHDHTFILADLTSINDINKLADIVPMLDGIVHCAGIGHRKLCKALSEDDVNTVMTVNFNSAVLLQAKLLSLKKIKKGASIVFISSKTAETPTVANSIYSASKGALKSYAECLALELAPKARVNCICPAMVWTDLIQEEGVSIEDLKDAEKSYPMKRYGKPEDIAYLAIYLLSDASSWMTGSSIDITGGAIKI